MAYAEYSYYTESYLLGNEPKIQSNEFDFFEKQAEKEIDRYTYYRIRRNEKLLSDEVRECVCEVAEALYEAEIAARVQRENGLAGPLVSWSNDGESGAVDISQSTCTESGNRAKIKEIIRKHLALTGLMYAGV